MNIYEAIGTMVQATRGTFYRRSVEAMFEPTLYDAAIELVNSYEQRGWITSAQRADIASCLTERALNAAFVK